MSTQVNEKACTYFQITDSKAVEEPQAVQHTVQAKQGDHHHPSEPHANQ